MIGGEVYCSLLGVGTFVSSGMSPTNLGLFLAFEFAENLALPRLAFRQHIVVVRSLFSGNKFGIIDSNCRDRGVDNSLAAGRIG